MINNLPVQLLNTPSARYQNNKLIEIQMESYELHIEGGKLYNIYSGILVVLTLNAQSEQEALMIVASSTGMDWHDLTCKEVMRS